MGPVPSLPSTSEIAFHQSIKIGTYNNVVTRTITETFDSNDLCNPISFIW